MTAGASLGERRAARLAQLAREHRPADVDALVAIAEAHGYQPAVAVAAAAVDDLVAGVHGVRIDHDLLGRLVVAEPRC